MMEAYGCYVANRFGSLLDDETDPFDLLQEAEREKEKRKKNKKEEEVKKGRQKKPCQKESQRDRRLPVASDEQSTVSGLFMWEALNPRAEGGSQTRREPEVEPIQGTRDILIRGTRETMIVTLERKGISYEDKRGGRGAWNWGSVGDAERELKDVKSIYPVSEPETLVKEENPSQSMDETGDMEVQVAMEMSLDEWKALQEMKRPKAEFNIRKPEDKIPAKARVLHQSKNVENLKAAMDNMEDGHFLRRSVNDITSLLDINFGSLGRANRGGRRRGRGDQTRSPERLVSERMVCLNTMEDSPQHCIVFQFLNTI
ncbi:intracellular hyaluronan-binding protein 4-like [Pholidichthys leucotaenia]